MSATPFSWFPPYNRVKLVLDEEAIEKIIKERFKRMDMITILENYELRQSQEPVTTEMVDSSTYDILFIWVENKLNKKVIVQVIGNVRNEPDGSVEIGEPVEVEAKDNHCISLKKEDILPYMGAKIRAEETPTEGTITIIAIGKR